MFQKRSSIRMLFVALVMGLVMVIGVGSAAAARSSKLLVNLDLQGLTALGDGFAYEGWAIVNGQPVSTGTFTIDANGRSSRTTFLFEADPRDVSAFVLTIEPVPDPDPAPSDVHILGGDFNGRNANLSTAHPAALGTDFAAASGSFILGVPSDASGATPYTNGIWWLDPAAGPGPGLSLPTLPAGWTYEGWVVGPNGPISTGTFTNPAAADSDAGGPYAGPDGTPPFPGQDFVNPPMDLTGYTAVISVEPVPDDSPMPFAIKPLVDSDIEALGAPGLSQNMALNLDSIPSGTATLARALRYRVTIENLTNGQPLSPPVIATHRSSADLFTVGEAALPEIEAIAETGDASGAEALLNSLTAVTSAINGGQPITPQGTAVGSFTDTLSVDIYARAGDRLTVATMLICTNDGFAGLDSVRLPRDTATYYAHAYDAGTEANTELSGDIVDPCSALGPVVLNGDPNGNEDTAVHTSGIITHHPGVNGSGDLLLAHNWDGPIARITVQLLDR